MTKKQVLINEIEHIPEPLLDEVMDFIRFLKTKLMIEGKDTAIASESSLKVNQL
ncbi:MAG: DUF2281 domain-containing protein [Bacteroidota bacterium]|nr:DUF2281 domain-containing protein [Bacteroidota bacterium]